MSDFPTVTAIAHPNIALVKYWGKRDTTYNLPAAGSLSLTLAGMQTRTRVRFDPALTGGDRIQINGQLLERDKAKRLALFLDRVRALSKLPHFAHVETDNDFPTSAGLASSASGFAALALASTRAANLQLDPKRLSILARLGSGSAARSIHGGWAEMLPGVLDDGSDCYARQVADAQHWDLRCLVAVCTQGPKAIGSTEAMVRTAKTSPYYDAWVADVPHTITMGLEAVQQRDFALLAQTAEASCLRMHACAMGAEPGILYWKGLTVELIHLIRALRAQGTPVFFTIDAGPHIKAFCTPEAEEQVARELSNVPGVLDVLHTRGGEGARIID